MFKQMGLLRANNNVNQSNMLVAMETWRHCWLTVNVQAVVTNSFLPHECRVRRLTAQRRSVIFPLHGDTDSVGNTHSLAVLLLRDHTWMKREGWKEIWGLYTSQFAQIWTMFTFQPDIICIPFIQRIARSLWLLQKAPIRCAEQYNSHTLISQPQNRLYYPGETIKF